MTHEDRIAEVLGAWQDQREQGHFVDPEALCAKHPDIADELRMRIAALNIVEQAFAESRMLEGEAPRRLGEYEIVRELGRGGMGVVYEAVQTSMQRTVALKVLFPSVTGSRRAVERFQREARAAGRVQHTNIVPVYSLSREGGSWYYAMELVQGSSLATILSRLRDLGDVPGEDHRTLLGTHDDDSDPERTTGDAADLPSPTASRFTETHGSSRYYRDVARLFSDVADALQAAHEEGVVHRDLKPSNLILDEKGVLKIVDFGIARIGAEASGMTVTGEILGTPIYMSPEQARAKTNAVDHRTDIYSLGASLYEVLTLRTPFKGSSFPEVYRQILTTQPVAPRRHSAAIPRDLETIVLKAMEKEPSQRYASAGAMAEDLRAFAAGYGIEARRVGPAARALRVVKRNPVRSGLAAALLLALTTAGYLGLQGASEERRRIDLEYAALLAGAESVTSGPWSGSKPLERYFRDQRRRRSAARLADLDKAILLDPARPDAWLRRGLASDRGQAERLADLAKAEDLGAPARTVRLARALVLRENGDREAAERIESEIAPSARTRPLDAYLQARLQRHRNEWKAAQATLDALLQGDGVGRFERLQALLMRARVRDRLGDREGAIQDLAACREQGVGALSLRVQMAWHWRCLGRTESAERSFGEILEVVAKRGDVASWQDLSDACAQARARPWAIKATEHAVRQRPAAVPLLLARFWALSRVGRSGTALAAAVQAVTLAPEDPHALYARGIAHLNRGELWRAWIDLRRATELRPEDAELLGGAASALSAMGKHRRALELRERQIGLDPKAPVAWRGKAFLLRGIRKFDEALAAYDRAHELDPSNAFVLVAKATTLRLAERPDEARRVLDAALSREALDAWTLTRGATELNNQKRYGEALQVADRAIELDPAYANPHYVRAFALYWLERHEEAKQACRTGLAIDPSDRTLRRFLVSLTETTEGPDAVLTLIERMLEDRPWDARVWQLKGYRLKQYGRIEEGLAALRKATEVEPDNPALQLDLCETLMLESDLDGASDAAHAALRLVSDDPHTLITAAGMLNTLGRHGQALELLAKAEELDPENGAVYAFRAFALRQRGELDAALTAAARGIELDPYDESTWEHRAYVLMDLGKREEALADLERSLALAPGSHHAGALRTHLLTALGRHEESLEAARALVAHHPRSTSALNALANVLGMRGESKEALALLEKADAIEPNSPAILGNLGHSLMSLGRVDEAIVALERAAALKPQGRVLADLSACYGVRGRHDDALRVLRQAVELEPPYYVAHYNLLHTLLGRNRLEEAVRWAPTMARRFPESPLPHFLRARALHGLGRRNEAVAAVQAGAEIVRPGQARDHMAWLTTLALLGQHRAVVDAFPATERAIRAYQDREPGNPEYAIGLANAQLHHAVALAKLGRHEDAARAHATALASAEDLRVQGPQESNARALLASSRLKFAYLRWEQGRLDEASALAAPGVALCQELERRGVVVPMWPLSGGEFLFLIASQKAKARRYEEASAYCAQAIAHVESHGGRHPELRKGEAVARGLGHALDLVTGKLPAKTLQDHLALAYFYSLRVRDMRSAYEAFRSVLADPQGRAHAEGMHLYNAACAACVLASETMEAEKATALRREAMTWLEQFVDDWKQRIAEFPPDSDPQARKALAERFEKMRQHALQDPDLKALRDSAAFQALFGP